MPSLTFSGRAELAAVPLAGLVPPRVTAVVRHRDREVGAAMQDFVTSAARSSRRLGPVYDRAA